MAVESNINQIQSMLKDLPIQIKDDAAANAMNAVSKISERALEQSSRLAGIMPSYVTGQDKQRSRKQKRQNERYGRSVTNWKSISYESVDATGAITGSPRLLGYRLWFLERGTKVHSRWGRSTGAGFRARPFVSAAQEKVNGQAMDIIVDSVNKTIKSYKK